MTQNADERDNLYRNRAPEVTFNIYIESLEDKCMRADRMMGGCFGISSGRGASRHRLQVKLKTREQLFA
jgi:hypothetical protein